MLWVTVLIILLAWAVAFFARRNGQISERNKINAIAVERAERNAKIMSHPIAPGTIGDKLRDQAERINRLPRSNRY